MAVRGVSSTCTRIPSFIGPNSDNGLDVENKPSAKSFLKASFELVPTDEGSTLRVLIIENMLAIAELTAEWKSTDYDYKRDPVPPNQPVETFPKKREREDLPDYSYVEKVALSYGDLPFQIVQIVSNVDRGGTIPPRPRSGQ